MLRRIATPLLALCGLAWVSCTGSAGSTAETQSGSALLDSLRSDRRAITTVRAYGSAKVSTNGVTYNGAIDISVHAPDSLRVKVTGPFGVLMGIVFASRRSYIAYNAWENTVMRGTLVPGEPLPFPGFPFRFDDAMEFLRGLPPMPEGTTTVVSPSCIEGRDSSGRFFKCELEPGGGRKAMIREPDGEQAFEYFRDFRRVDGIQFPYHISAQLRDHQSVTIDFDEVALHTPSLDFSIPVPASARQVGSN